MLIARVVGNVVATQKHRKFEGAKLMLVQPINLDESPALAWSDFLQDKLALGLHESPYFAWVPDGSRQAVPVAMINRTVRPKVDIEAFSMATRQIPARDLLLQ